MLNTGSACVSRQARHRLLRGALSAVISIAIGVLAHALGHMRPGSGAAGFHHLPHPVVILFALLIGIPVATALSRIRLSRGRLAATVLLTQGVLHGLFALLPASHSAALGVSSVTVSGHTHVVGLQASQTISHAGTQNAGFVMMLSHCLAAAGAYALLRRGELILQTLHEVLSLKPVLLLLLPRVSGTPRIPAAVEAAVGRPAHMRPIIGSPALRGPPAV